jgi:hypothetical protein
VDTVEVFRRILRDTVRPDMPDADVLSRMVVLHTHSLELNEPPSGHGHAGVLAPLTRTHVAELVADRFPAGTPRAETGYWFAAYGRETPYELIDDVPAELRGGVDAARDAIARHELVRRLLPE